MEGIFGNIFYLIPIAFIIAIRILNARNKQSRKPPPKAPINKPASEEPKNRPEGRRGLIEELLLRAEEAQKRLYNKEREETNIPPQVQQVPASAGSVEVKKKKLPKKQPVKQPVKQPASFPAEAPKTMAFYEQANEKTQEVQSGEESRRTGQQIDWTSQIGLFLKNLTPLQQAVVWSEILGQPKGY